jgi:outer membrane lipoprotein LolB
MILPVRRVAWGLVFATLFIAGCAQPPRATTQFDAKTGPWSGRLALQVQDNQSQSFSAAFELRGQAAAGELTLFTPLGGTAAVLSWAPGAATLKANGQVRQFSSVDELVAQATGSPLPVAALFDWLGGTNVPVPGWEADLSQLGEGRLRASRLQPPPAAELRVVLDR